jgi:hypothetical protein
MTYETLDDGSFRGSCKFLQAGRLNGSFWRYLLNGAFWPQPVRYALRRKASDLYYGARNFTDLSAHRFAT